MILYHPFIWCPDYLWKGESEVRRSSILPPAVSTCGFQSAFKLAVIWRLRRQRRPWLCAGSWRMETLMSTSLHMSAKIHVLFLDYFALGLGIIQRRSMKSPSSFVGVVGRWISTCGFQSAFKLAVIWRLRRQRRPWLCAGSWRMETLMSTSLHMSAKIHVLFLDYFALGLGIIQRRSMKSPSSFVGVVGRWRWIRVRR